MAAQQEVSLFLFILFLFR